LKSQPGSPARVGLLADAHAYCATFFAWDNQQHRDSGIGMMKPEVVCHSHTSCQRPHGSTGQLWRKKPLDTEVMTLTDLTVAFQID
jgi:hypothetical protein